MKALFIVFLLAVALVANCTMREARADGFFLNEATVVSEPEACPMEGKMYACVVVMKDKQYYVVLVDRIGVYRVYAVEIEQDESRISIKKHQLVWSRNMV